MTLRRRPARRGTLAIIAAAAAVIAVGVAVVIIALGSTGSGHRRLNGGVTGGALVTPPVTLSASPGPGPASPAAPAPGADPSPHPVPPSPDTAPGHATPSPSARRTGGGPATSANSSRVFTVVNATSRTIWVAATRNSDHPLANTGWRLAPGATVTFPVPSKWGGRIWGRTGCAFDGSGHGHCVTGDCAGGFQCTASGATPATLAEFSLGAWNGLDFYDVSLVDGSNLPMYINISHTTTKDPVSASGCVTAGCTKPVACPAGPMRVMSGGTVAGCRTACAAYGGDAYCCRGAWSGRANCDPAKWPVDYTAVFKKAEPYAYSYAYDDSATMSCRGGCDYRITFGVTPGAS